MATNTVTGVLVCSDGTNIPLKKELAEGTETDLTTDTVYTVSAQNVGDYAPGKTIKAAIITSKTFIGYAYILRQGLVAVTLPIGSRTAGGSGANPLNLCKNFTLQPGDKVWAYLLA